MNETWLGAALLALFLMGVVIGTIIGASFLSGAKREVTSSTPQEKEWKRHQKSLRLFNKERTSMGMYGDDEDLFNAKLALRYFGCVPYPEKKGVDNE